MEENKEEIEDDFANATANVQESPNHTPNPNVNPPPTRIVTTTTTTHTSVPPKTTGTKMKFSNPLHTSHDFPPLNSNLHEHDHNPLRPSTFNFSEYRDPLRDMDHNPRRHSTFNYSDYRDPLRDMDHNPRRHSTFNYSDYRDPLRDTDQASIASAERAQSRLNNPYSYQPHSSTHTPHHTPSAPFQRESKQTFSQGNYYNYNNDMQGLADAIEQLRHGINDALTLRHLAGTADPHNARLLTESIAAKQAILNMNKARFEKMQQLRETRNSRFVLPPDNGRFSKIKNLLDLVPKGSPDLNTLLTRIIETSIHQNLSHADIRTLLVNSLTGEPLKVYQSMRDKPLQHLFNTLEVRFLPPDTVSFYTSQLHNFARDPDERLDCCLERARYLIRQSASAFDEEDRPGRERTLCHSILMKVVHKNVQSWLSLQEEKSLRQGHVLSISELISLAEDAEALAAANPLHPEGNAMVKEDVELNESSSILKPPRLKFPTPGAAARTERSPSRESRGRARSVEDRRDERRRQRSSISRDRRDSVVSQNRSRSTEYTDSRPPPPQTWQQQQPRPYRPPQQNFTNQRSNAPPSVSRDHRDPLYYHPQIQRQATTYDLPSPSFRGPYEQYDPNTRYRPMPRQPFRQIQNMPRHEQRNSYRPQRSRPVITTHGPMVQRVYLTEQPYLFQEFNPEGMQQYRQPYVPPRQERQNYRTPDRNYRQQYYGPTQQRYQQQQQHDFRPRFQTHQNMAQRNPNYRGNSFGAQRFGVQGHRRT